MSLNHLSSDSLRALIVLAEKREKLIRELSALESQITKALGGTGVGRGSVRRGDEVQNGRSNAKSVRQRGKRGATKERILVALKAAGSSGISVKELSANLGLKNQNVHVWFNTTGKKLKNIEKTGKGIYRLKESGVKVEPAAAPEKSGKKTSRVSSPKTSARKSRLTGKK